jgi:hypothetical protein
MFCPCEYECREWPADCPLLPIIRRRRRTYLLEATLFLVIGLTGAAWLALEVWPW